MKKNALLVFSVAAMAASVPSPQEQAAMNDHHAIPGLTGLENARDLGGYYTADGQYQVKSGLLLRSYRI